jgi:methionyl-tRNA formyltransferase
MKNKILFLSANELGFQVFSQCQETVDAEFFVLTLSKDSKVVMYDGIELDMWYSTCNNVFEISSIRESKVKDVIKKISPDLIIMCGWRQIVNEEILNIPKLGTIAFHPSPLPKGRGPAPIINSILEGWKESAVTMFYPDSGTDSGDIIDQYFFNIEADDYAYDVYKKCINASRILIKRNISDVLLGKANRKSQDNKSATYLKKLSIEDNKISYDCSPEHVYRKIRAFSYPYLGAFFEIGDKKIIIDKARVCTKIKKY